MSMAEALVASVGIICGTLLILVVFVAIVGGKR